MFVIKKLKKLFNRNYLFILIFPLLYSDSSIKEKKYFYSDIITDINDENNRHSNSIKKLHEKLEETITNFLATNKIYFKTDEKGEISVKVFTSNTYTDSKLIEVLPKVERTFEKYGFKEIKITSMVRGEKKNEDVGGEKNSKHLRGGAIDISVKTNDKFIGIKEQISLGLDIALANRNLGVIAEIFTGDDDRNHIHIYINDQKPFHFHIREYTNDKTRESKWKGGRVRRFKIAKKFDIFDAFNDIKFFESNDNDIPIKEN